MYWSGLCVNKCKIMSFSYCSSLWRKRRSYTCSNTAHNNNRASCQVTVCGRFILCKFCVVWTFGTVRDVIVMSQIIKGKTNGQTANESATNQLLLLLKFLQCVLLYMLAMDCCIRIEFKQMIEQQSVLCMLCMNWSTVVTCRWSDKDYPLQIQRKMNCLRKGKAFEFIKVTYMATVVPILLFFIRLKFWEKR